MRAAIVFAVVFASLLAFGVYRLLGGEDGCRSFGSDVALAVTAPDKAPDPGDHGALEPGSCSFVETKTFDAHAFGWERHSKHTIAGSIYIFGDDRQHLHDEKVALEEEGGVTITALPNLGPGAFLATRTTPAAPTTPSVDALPDPAAAAPPLPATAYWVSDHFGSASVSASGDGATVEQAQRATARLAELVNRRPVKVAS